MPVIQHLPQKSFIVDTSFWPIVITQLPATLTRESLDELFTQHEAILSRKDFYVTMTDLSLLKSVPNAAVRRSIADWQNQHKDRMARYCSAAAIIITNTVVRGGLTALHWLSPPPQPTQVFATQLEGIDFLINHLQLRNVSLPLSLEDLTERYTPKNQAAAQ